MALQGVDGDDGGVVPTELPGPREFLRRAGIKGLAIVFPLVITLFVVSFVVGFVWDQLQPLAAAVVDATFLEGELFVTATTLSILAGVVLLAGAYAEFGPDTGIGQQFDEFMASIPGVGSVYTSFNEMSELLLESDTDSFQDVKLVEFATEDSYALAFLTAETPAVVSRDTGLEDMVTLFVPMAPNPVMGGFVLHVSTEHVVDVDMTVEQGVRSIVTSGVAMGEDEDVVAGLTEEQMRRLGRVGPGSEDDRQVVADVDGPNDRERDVDAADVDHGHTGEPADDDGAGDRPRRQEDR